jgi:hypothetical protein
MTMQDISNQAAAAGFNAEQMEILFAAFHAGMEEGIRDAAITCADNDELSAAELLAENNGFEIA